jgi:hypothetical protein
MFGVRRWTPHASTFVGVLITHRVQVVTEDDGRIAFTINPFFAWLTWRLLTSFAEQPLERCEAEADPERDHPEGSLGLERAGRGAALG